MAREASSSSLDFYKRNRNRTCGGLASMGPVLGPSGIRYGYARTYCKAWDCSYCGRRKAARVCRRIAAAAKEHGLNRFLTLTLDPKTCTKEEDLVRYIRQVWRKFRVYLKRQHGKSVEFIAVLEEHKSGIPHMHVLLDRYILQAWISEAWSALGGGRIVFIEKVKNLETIGWYLGKYLTKDMLLSHGRGVRRYTTSRGVKLTPKTERTGWHQAPAPIEELMRAAGAAAADVVEDARGAVKSFSTDKPIKRLKGLGGQLKMVSPNSVIVNPDEADGSADWDEVGDLLSALRQQKGAGTRP